MKRSVLKNAVGPAVLLATVSMVGWGCDILDEGTPETARVTLEGGGDREIEIVTSNDFSITSEDDGETREVYLYSADTTSVTPSFNQKYSLGSEVRFYIAASTDEPLDQAVTMKVFIDGEQRYNVTSTLGDQELEFLYSFR
jgi:hypothetical protein